MLYLVTLQVGPFKLLTVLEVKTSCLLGSINFKRFAVFSGV